MAELDITVKGVDSVNQAADAIAKGAANTKSLKAQLRELQSELSSLDPSSDKFQQLASQAGEVKDKMNDAAEATRASAGPAFETLGNNASLLTQRLGSLDFEGVSQAVKGMAGSIGKVSFKEIVGGIKSMGSALGTLGKALLTNPIFLIAGVLALIATNLDVVAKIIPGVGTAMDSLKESITGVSAEMNKALADSKKLTEEAQKQLDTTSASENILKLQGKSEKDILQLKISQTKAVIDGLKAQISSQETINKAQVEAAKRNKEILRGVLQFITAPLQILLATVDQVGSALGQNFGLRDAFNNNVSNLFFDPEQTKLDGEAAIAEQRKQLLALENNVAGYQLSINSINKAAADKRREEKQKEDDAFLKAQQEVGDLMAQLEAEQLAAEMESERVRKEMLYKANEDRIATEENYYNLSEELRLAQLSKEEADREREIADLVAQYEKKFELANGNAELEKQLAEQQAADIAAINAASAEKEKERQKALNESKFQMASDVLGALGELNNAFNNGSEQSARRAFAVNKALSLAQAIMSTYQAVNAQLAVPQDALTGANFVKAGIALAAGLANVVKITKTKFEPSGGGSAPSGGGGISAPSSIGGGGGGTNAPSFNAFNPAFLQNRPNQSPTVQAYVVSGNVSSELEASTKIKDKSRL